MRLLVLAQTLVLPIASAILQKPYDSPAANMKAALLLQSRSTCTIWLRQGAWERVLPRFGSAHMFASQHDPTGGAELTFWSAAACLCQLRHGVLPEACRIASC